MRAWEKVVVEEHYYVEAFSFLENRVSLPRQAERRPDVCDAIRISDEACDVIVSAIAYENAVRSTALLSKFAKRFAQYSRPANCIYPNCYANALKVAPPLAHS